MISCYIGLGSSNRGGIDKVIVSKGRLLEVIIFLAFRGCASRITDKPLIAIDMLAGATNNRK